jgi:hypothetical protein
MSFVLRFSYWHLHRTVGINLSWVDVVTEGQSAYPPWCRTPLWGPWPDFTFSFLLPEKCFDLRFGALSDDRTGLQFVVQSVSGQSRGGLIAIHYCLILDYSVPFPSPLTICRDYGGSILTRLHTGAIICLCIPLLFAMCINTSSKLVWGLGEFDMGRGTQRCLFVINSGKRQVWDYH